MPKVVPLALSKDRALAIVKAAANDTARVIWTSHAGKRMRQRRITPTQVLNCMRSGVITEGPYWDAVHGTWPLTMERMSAGEELKVGLAIDLRQSVVVITVI